MDKAFIYAIYNIGLLLINGAFLWALYKNKLQHATRRKLLVGLILLGAVCWILLSVIRRRIDPYALIRLISWFFFIHLPLFLAGLSWITFSRRQPRRAALLGFLSFGLLFVCVDAFLIEPRWMETTILSIKARNLTEPVRIAVIADIQTDAPGEYERRVFAQVMDLKPDMILFLGDTIQIGDPGQYMQAGAKLNVIMKEAQLSAPLGMFAVDGNIDGGRPWESIFAGLAVVTIDKSVQRFDTGPLVLTMLSHNSSRNSQINIPYEDKFHIVMGHTPDYSLGDVQADLLLAGHTHGGQIQLPFFGPVLTLSNVPRRWASGMTEIAPGKTLIVSRGIGMERGNAPRMRLLCRPQLVILDLRPAN